MAKKFAVFDIDGTLIRWQLYHATTDELAKNGYLAPQDYEQIRKARLDWKVRGHANAFKTYETYMIKAFEKIIQDITVQQFELAVDSVIKQYKDQVYTYTANLIKDLKAKGYVLLAVSGSQRELVARIAAYYGFDDYVGTDYLQNEGRFTGEKKFYAHDKKKTLEHLIRKHTLDLTDSLAIGDSASDIPMLELTEQAIAFNPEQTLFKHAQQSGWLIVVERKNVIYRLEPHGGSYILA